MLEIQEEASIASEIVPEPDQQKIAAAFPATGLKKRRRLKVAHPERCIGCLGCMFACSRIRTGTVSLDSSAIKVQTQGGIEGDYRMVVCRACRDPPCARACPTGALEKKADGRVVFHKDLCQSLRKMSGGLSCWRHRPGQGEAAHKVHSLRGLCGFLPPWSVGDGRDSCGGRMKCCERFST